MTRKILIVEDEAISAMALRYAVERIGCAVIGTADSGEEAVRQASRHRPDLILMDTRLRTEMTGVEAANLIWSRERIPCVFISAYTANELAAQYRGPQPFLLLPKPVLDGDLEAMIGRLFDRESGADTSS